MLKRSLLPLFLAMALSSSPCVVSGQNDGGLGLFGKGKVSVKLNEVEEAFWKQNIKGVVKMSRELLSEVPDDPRVRYWLGRGYYKQREFDRAEKNLKKALSDKEDVPVEAYLIIGKVHHRRAELDTAIFWYQRFKTKAREEGFRKGELERIGVDRFIEQCQYAKKMMKDPVDVEMKNMGEKINSSYDEYTPCITVDQQTMVFTARKPDTKGGGVDKKGDHRFYEDIYITHRHEEEGYWKKPENLPGKVNTVHHDAVLSISPDGEKVFVYRNNEEHAGDIFYSTKSAYSGEWTKPELMPDPVNSSYYEGSITTTADEKTVFFISERKGGYGRGDIYVSHKDDDGDWSQPGNLGPKVNTKGDEKFVHVHPDGKTLFFATNGRKTLGSYDIFKTSFVDGHWTEPVNLGYPINTVNEESTFSLTSDYRNLYLAAHDEDGYGKRDLVRVDLKAYDVLSLGSDKTTHGTVSGTITSDEGRPLSCNVRFYQLGENEELVGLTSTDDEGNYVIRLQVGHDYRIKVEKPGYRPNSDTFGIPDTKGKERPSQDQDLEVENAEF